ncbi:MAG: 50S ribosomal protein L20 [Patescibacteria group bacterium]|jgi:large subunit ribosomal protein L20
MPRVKRGVQHAKTRRNLLKRVKGYQYGRKNLPKQAHPAVLKAGVHAYVGRKKKKRDYRGLWQIRISAAVKEQGLSYSKFMGLLHKKNIALDRKVLAQLAAEHPAIFAAIVAEVKK